MNAVTAAGIRARVPEDLYAAYHAPRFVAVLTLVDRLWPALASGRTAPRALDVGHSLLTYLLAEAVKAPVDVLGFDPDGPFPTGVNWHFDLNSAQSPGTCRTDLPSYDLVVMAEVIEHLHTAPRLVLEFMKSLVRPGGVLILQTPNAAAWNKRLLLLAGRHPYDQISPNPRTPAHFREYTRKEIVAHAADAGFTVEQCLTSSYFDHRYRFRPELGRYTRSPALWWVNVVAACMPPSLRRGITLVLRRPT